MEMFSVYKLNWFKYLLSSISDIISSSSWDNKTNLFLLRVIKIIRNRSQDNWKSDIFYSQHYFRSGQADDVVNFFFSAESFSTNWCPRLWPPFSPCLSKINMILLLKKILTKRKRYWRRSIVKNNYQFI